MVRDVDEIEEILEEVEKKILFANRNDELDDLLEKIGLNDYIDKKPEIYNPTRNGKIVIIGDSEVKKEIIIAIFKNYGINKDRLELCLDYKEAEKFNYKNLQYNFSYSAVLVGPIPHSVNDKNNFSSIVARMEQEEGFPQVFRLCGNNKLKITKASLKNAINKMAECGIITFNI